MAYASLADAEKAVNATNEAVGVVSGMVNDLAKRVSTIETDGLREVKEQLAVLAKPKVEAVEVKPCLALEDVQSIVAETLEVWRTLETACSKLVAKGIVYQRRDSPETGIYKVRFYRLEEPKEVV